MVLGEIFGELVARVFVAPEDAVHDPGFLEKPDVPVHRALRQALPALEDVGDRQRPVRGSEHIDDGTAALRVPLVVMAKPRRGSLVEIDAHTARLPGSENE